MEPGVGFWAGLHSDSFIIISLEVEWILNPAHKMSLFAQHPEPSCMPIKWKNIRS